MTRVDDELPGNRLSPNDFGALQTFVNQLRNQKPLGRHIGRRRSGIAEGQTKIP